MLNFEPGQSTDEYLDVLDCFGRRTGRKKLRTEVHRDGDWHRVAHIWIMSARDEILLQRRTLSKKTHPGMLDVSCAGHLLAGDTSKAGALRELSEELGLKLMEADLEFLTTIKRFTTAKTGIIDNQYIDIFLVHTDWEVDDFSLQADEVAEVFYVPLPDLQKMVVEGHPELVDRGEEYHILFQKLGGG